MSEQLTGDQFDVDTMGPVDYLILEFPGNRMTGDGIPLLLELVENRTIRILDLAFIMKDPDGRTRALKITDLDDESAREFAIFEGASSGLLATEDFGEAAN